MTFGNKTEDEIKNELFNVDISALVYSTSILDGVWKGLDDGLKGLVAKEKLQPKDKIVLFSWWGHIGKCFITVGDGEKEKSGNQTVVIVDVLH